MKVPLILIVVQNETNDNCISGALNSVTNQELNNNLNKILGEYNLGFKRPERLDVKKPGPPFDGQITTESSKSFGINI